MEEKIYRIYEGKRRSIILVQNMAARPENRVIATTHNRNQLQLSITAIRIIQQRHKNIKS